MKSLDAAALAAEGAAVIAAAAPYLADLERRCRERSELLERINAPGFWEDRSESVADLERYRELDVAIRAGERFAAPIRRLAEADSPDAVSTAGFARRLEEAARALRAFEERLAAEGPAAVWLVLSRVDALHPAGEWIAQLVTMELAWCRALSLAAAVVAYEESDGDLARAVLEVEGPTAGAYLAMEHGVHRLSRGQGVDPRVAVEVIPRARERVCERVLVQPVRRRQGMAGLRPAWRGRLRLDHRGLTLDLLAEDRQPLVELLGDLAHAWGEAAITSPEPARLYGGGAGATDPRTGVVAPRLKEVLKGRLDPFLQGWLRWRRPNLEGPPPGQPAPAPP